MLCGVVSCAGVCDLFLFLPGVNPIRSPLRSIGTRGNGVNGVKSSSGASRARRSVHYPEDDRERWYAPSPSHLRSLLSAGGGSFLVVCCVVLWFRMLVCATCSSSYRGVTRYVRPYAALVLEERSDRCEREVAAQPAQDAAYPKNDRNRGWNRVNP